MRDVIWDLLERRLRRSVPSAHLRSTLGDLAEDYADRRASLGPIRARVWLFREARSLSRAYRLAEAAGRSRRRLMVMSDIGRAWRRLRARPGPALMCASLLALGVGLTTTMFSVVDALVLRPAPFRDPGRLVRQRLPPSGASLMVDWRASEMFETVEAASELLFAFEGRSWPGARLTSGVFDMLGVRPLRGRAFSAIAAGAGAPDEVVLSETIWRSVFDSDPALVGRRIHLGDAAVIVVGIMPAAFRFPAPATVVWRPLDVRSPGRDPLTIFGRLKPAVPFTAANDHVRPFALQLPELSRNRTSGPPLHLVDEPPLSDFIRRALGLLLAGVVFVFLVLCANASSLLLANLSARRREFAMCTALGASRARLVREVAAEHTFIGIVGAAVGVGLAWGLTSVVPQVFVGLTLNPIDIDVRTLLTASALGVVSVTLAGFIPAWIGTRTDPIRSVGGSRQAATETRAAHIAARGLLVVQVALACSLLVGSVLLVRSFSNLMRADRGLNSEGVVRMRITGLDDAFASADPLATVNAMSLAGVNIEESFAAWPSISAIALSRELPPGHTQDGRAHLGPPGTMPDPDAGVRSDIYRVSPAFFPLYGIEIVHGRTFEPGDSEHDVIVGERLAAWLWPGENPVGRTFAVDRFQGAHRVVGVAREIRLPTLDPALDLPEFYRPLGRDARTLYLNFRCRASCPTEADIGARLRTVHPAIRARFISPLEEAYLSQLRLPRATAAVAGAFAVVAVLTAAGGLFSVLTYAVGRRRREFGIRTALGARPAQMRRLVFRDGLSVLVAGVGLGLLGGWIVGRSLSAFHYGVTAADPVTWLGVVGTIALTSLAAAWRPARQAMRVDPVKLLREE